MKTPVKRQMGLSLDLPIQPPPRRVSKDQRSNSYSCSPSGTYVVRPWSERGLNDAGRSDGAGEPGRQANRGERTKAKTGLASARFGDGQPGLDEQPGMIGWGARRGTSPDDRMAAGTFGRMLRRFDTRRGDKRRQVSAELSSGQDKPCVSQERIESWMAGNSARNG